MKNTLYWIVVSFLALITPVQEYIITSEALILLNWIADYYVWKHHRRRHKKRRTPFHIQMFFIVIVIILSRHIDNVFLHDYSISYGLSLGLVLFELKLLYDNISILLGFNINKYIKKNGK